MRIEHLAIWVKDLEKMKAFYEQYFDCVAGELYHNPKKNFTSYFLSFDAGCRLEIMAKPEIPSLANNKEHIGITHFAIALGSKEKVDELTEKLRADGLLVVSEVRTTGDGYYESVVLDPEGNRLELTV